MFLHNADCGQLRTLHHVLSMRAERCYDARHNAALAELTCFISCHLSHCDWARTTRSLWTFPLRSTGRHITSAPPTLNLTWWSGMMLSELCSSLNWHALLRRILSMQPSGKTQGIMTLPTPSGQMVFSVQSGWYRSGPVVWLIETASWTCFSFLVYPGLLLLACSVVCQAYIVLKESYFLWCYYSRPTDSYDLLISTMTMHWTVLPPFFLVWLNYIHLII